MVGEDTIFSTSRICKLSAHAKSRFHPRMSWFSKPISVNFESLTTTYLTIPMNILDRGKSTPFTFSMQRVHRFMAHAEEYMHMSPISSLSIAPSSKLAGWQHCSNHVSPIYASIRTSDLVQDSRSRAKASTCKIWRSLLVENHGIGGIIPPSIAFISPFYTGTVAIWSSSASSSDQFCIVQEMNQLQRIDVPSVIYLKLLRVRKSLVTFSLNGKGFFLWESCELVVVPTGNAVVLKIGLGESCITFFFAP